MNFSLFPILAKASHHIHVESIFNFHIPMYVIKTILFTNLIDVTLLFMREVNSTNKKVDIIASHAQLVYVFSNKPCNIVLSSSCPSMKAHHQGLKIEVQLMNICTIQISFVF